MRTHDLVPHPRRKPRARLRRPEPRPLAAFVHVSRRARQLWPCLEKGKGYVRHIFELFPHGPEDPEVEVVSEVGPDDDEDAEGDGRAEARRVGAFRVVDALGNL